MRGASKTEDIHLNVTLWDHQLFSKDNRRLVVLLMFQALRRDKSIKARGWSHAKRMPMADQGTVAGKPKANGYLSLKLYL